MPKSREPLGTTARELNSPKDTQQFTVILSSGEARALHLLAQRDGMKAAGYFRRYIREQYRTVFGKEVA